MTDEGLLQWREELSQAIAGVRSEAEAVKGLGVRVQEDICRMLDEALECLEKKDNVARSLNKASCRVCMARRRLEQAQGQRRRLAVPIGLWMVAFIAVAAWLIFTRHYWPVPSGDDSGGGVAAVLYGSVVWGMLGASIDGLREVHTRLARQELDPNRAGWYFAHPVLGAGLGGILFLVVSAGLLVTAEDLDTFNPALPLLLSALAGFEQQHVIRYCRETVRHILRIEESSPNEGG